MKILHVIPKIKNGGVESAVFSALESINDESKFKLITIESSSKKSHLKGIINLSSSILNPLIIIKFIRIIWSENPDVIVYSLWKSSFLGLLVSPFIFFKRKKIKTAVIIHSARYAHVFDRIISKIAVKNFDKVYCDSSKTKDFTFNNTGVEGEVISFILRRPEVKNKNYTSKLIKFVFVGRLNKIKNVERTIDFMHILNLSGLDFIYHIYGPDEGVMDNCMNKILKYQLSDKIIFKGEISNHEVPTILKDYDLLLQFSSNEGMAMSVVEAMQVGLIPCVTNVGQIDTYAKHLYNSFILDVEKINSDSYIHESAHSLLKLLFNDSEFNRISCNAAKTFDGQLTYAEDFEKKMANSIMHE